MFGFAPHRVKASPIGSPIGATVFLRFYLMISHQVSTDYHFSEQRTSGGGIRPEPLDAGGGRTRARPTLGPPNEKPPAETAGGFTS